MNKDAIKDLMYGGIRELMQNNTYYYYSSVGVEFCHWTKEGQEALFEYVNLVSQKMIEAENNDLNHRAKRMVLDNLKGESD